MHGRPGVADLTLSRTPLRLPVLLVLAAVAIVLVTGFSLVGRVLRDGHGTVADRALLALIDPVGAAAAIGASRVVLRVH